MKLLQKTLFAALFVILAMQVAFAQNNSNATNGTAGNGTAAVNASAKTTPALEPSATPEPTGAQLLDLEVSYYLDAVESGQTSNFTADGKAYYLVKVGGKNQLVLDSRYQPVSNEAEIKRLMAAYVSNLPLPFKRSDFDSLKSEFATVNASWDYCKNVWWEFISGKRICIEQTTRKLQCWIIYDGDFGSTFAIPSATAENRHAIGNGTNEVSNATIQLADIINRTDADFDSLGLEALKARLAEMKNGTGQIRHGYTIFKAAHTQYLKYSPFATDGGLNRCAFNEASLANMEKLVDATALFPSAGALANQTIEGTKARLDKGSVRKLGATVDTELSDFDKKYKKIKADFEAANQLEPTAITSAFVELTTLSLSVKNSSGYASAKSKSDNFESKRSAAEALIGSSSLALAPYADSLQKLNNVSLTLEAATKVYGQNDPRLNEMKTQLATLRSNLELKEADLKHGRPVTAADFQAIADNATNMTATANSLPRKENEIDWLLVGGLIVLVALIGGAVWYLRQYKKKQQMGS